MSENEQQPKEERVHHVCENIYNKYDSMNSIICFQRHTAWRKNDMEKMYVKRGAQALAVCAGTGDWSISLAEEIGPEGKVIGLDVSDNMLMVANQKKKQHPPMPQLEF